MVIAEIIPLIYSQGC